MPNLRVSRCTVRPFIRSVTQLCPVWPQDLWLILCRSCDAHLLKKAWFFTASSLVSVSPDVKVRSAVCDGENELESVVTPAFPRGSAVLNWLWSYSEHDRHVLTDMFEALSLLCIEGSTYCRCSQRLHCFTFSLLEEFQLAPLLNC